jgi:hypothetical protein
MRKTVTILLGDLVASSARIARAFVEHDPSAAP